MSRLVLVDGTNFFFKGSWGGDLLHEGISIKYTWAFFKNFISLMKMFEQGDEQVKFVICWDGGYDERTRISNQAVQDGIIKKAYKQERREAKALATVTPEEIADRESFLRQLNQVQEILTFTRIRQLRVEGEEADDLIGSLVESERKNFDEVVVVTSDKDYYQLLYDNVRIYNSIKKCFIDIEFLKKEFGLSRTEQWVDVGALAGEKGATSDTIYGVDGISYITGSKLIAKHGTLDNLLKFAKEKIQPFIDQYGSLKNVEVAFIEDKIKLKDCKKEFNVLLHEDVVKVAYQLKKMRTWLNCKIPEINADWKKLDVELKNIGFRISEADFDRLVLERKDSPLPQQGFLF